MVGQGNVKVEFGTRMCYLVVQNCLIGQALTTGSRSGNLTTAPMEESTFFVRNMSVSPIGSIRIACFVKNGAGVLTRTRILPHYTLVYVLRGDGFYEDENGYETDVRPGDAVLVQPGLEHWYGPPADERWDELYLVFEGPVFDLWRKEGCFDTTEPVIPLHPTDYWLDRFKQAIGDNNDGDPVKMMAEAMRMQRLLMDIQHASRESREADIKWLESAKAALETYERPQDAADSMSIAYEAFRKKFRRLSGIPPGKYRIAVTMERACHLLSSSSQTLREIADELGYCDEYHFSKQFSKTIGWSPREYRARTPSR